MKRVILGLFLLAFIIPSLSMYEGNSAVKLITAKDFHHVKKGVWLVQFFAEWCGHCKQLAPEYEKAAQALKGIAHIAAIDASKEQTDIQIKGYPTIKLFVDGKVTDYDGGRDANSFVDYMLKTFRKLASQRLGGKGGKGSSKGQESHSGHGHNQESGDSDEKDVIVLGDDDFEEQVYGDDSAWFVEFYAPWCGHCKSLAPEYAELATQLKGEVKVGKVDATVHKEAPGRFGVSGYPTIKFFPAGKKDDSSAIPYEGQRNAQAMADWAREQTGSAKKFNHVRLTSQAVYDEYCKAKNLCVITFLPHILDSSESERQGYLERLKEVALKFRGKPFKFLWSQGGDHFEFEEKLGAIGVGYPVVNVIYESKKMYGKLKKAFSEQNLESYLSEIVSNKARFTKLPELSALKKVEEKEVKASEEAYGEKKDGSCDEQKCTAPPSQSSGDEL